MGEFPSENKSRNLTEKKLAFGSFRVKRNFLNLFIKGKKCTDFCIELPGLCPKLDMLDIVNCFRQGFMEHGEEHGPYPNVELVILGDGDLCYVVGVVGNDGGEVILVYDGALSILKILSFYSMIELDILTGASITPL